MLTWLYMGFKKSQRMLNIVIQESRNNLVADGRIDFASLSVCGTGSLPMSGIGDF